jgi:RNA polymerase sigma-70 factor (ECF subfamily)
LAAVTALTPTSGSAPGLASQPAARERLTRLLQLVARQDRSAFEALYDLTSAHLLGVAWQVLRDRDHAEEVLQEAYVKVWFHAERFDPAIASPMTWLTNVVRNRAIDAHRQERARRVETESVGDDPDAWGAGHGPGPEELLQQAIVASGIDRCMGELQPKQRQALALAYYRGLGQGDIARVLVTPLGTVKGWLQRGMDDLRHCLEAAGILNP